MDHNLVNGTHRGSLRERLYRRTKISKSGCWDWIGTKLPIGRYGRGGYGTIGLGAAGLGKGYVHRVSFQIHIGTIPDGMYVLHSCDNRSCVNPDHLFLGTAKDNSLDAQRKGRRLGRKRKLKKRDVQVIRRLLSSGINQYEIAHAVGISQGTVSNIHRRVRAYK